MNKAPSGFNMKNAEFASVRGVPAVVVSLRAAGLLSTAKRDFIWYVQGLSLKDGGFRRVARELLEIFPERIGTQRMRDLSIVPGKEYPPEIVAGVMSGFTSDRWFMTENPPLPMKGSELIDLCRRRALTNHAKPHYDPCSPWGEDLSIEEFLIELCTNPQIKFLLPGVDSALDELEIKVACEQNPELSEYDFTLGQLGYFRDIIGALCEYRTRQEKKRRADFHLTTIGKKIWETLDYALAGRGMVLLDGLEGRGKTEAVKAWCELHSSRARLVSLKGVTNKTTAFREIAAALGITYAYARTGPEMQARIEDVLNRSKIMLVIDEAHFAFNQTRQMTSRPELIDWIDTAFCNRGVPVALVTTPQFIACMARAKNQVEWNFNQFRRRVKRWVTLPPQNTEADIAAVARKVFRDSGEAAIKKIVGYALLSKRDLSAVGDVASEVRAMLGTEDLAGVSVEHIHRAITEFLIPSDQAFKVALAEAEAKQPKYRRSTPPLPQEASIEACPVDAAWPEPEQVGMPTPDRIHGNPAAPLVAQSGARPEARFSGAALTAI